jgi:hypothetical protein
LAHEELYGVWDEDQLGAEADEGEEGWEDGNRWALKSEGQAAWEEEQGDEEEEDADWGEVEEGGAPQAWGLAPRKRTQPAPPGGSKSSSSGSPAIPLPVASALAAAGALSGAAQAAALARARARGPLAPRKFRGLLDDRGRPWQKQVRGVRGRSGAA